MCRRCRRGKYLAGDQRLQPGLDRPCLDPGEPKETELTWVRPGQKATISRRQLSGPAVWHRHGRQHQPGLVASFSLLPAQNTSGNWVKVVQRIADARDDRQSPGKPPLRAGMSVVVGIDTGHARGLPDFVTDLIGKSGSSKSHDQRVRRQVGTVANRGAITACVILATIMQALDTTIANVALALYPGQRFGERRPDQLGADLLHRRGGDHDAAFGLPGQSLRPQARALPRSSASSSPRCCAAFAQSLPQIVGFRLLQGLFGAALVPLSQSILLDIYSPKSAARRWRCSASRSWSGRCSARSSAAG
jgi:hypothetical protein